jgi:hypothetical protein
MRRNLLLAFLLFAVCPLFATEPNPSQRQRELIEKLLTLMNMDKTAAGVIDAMYAEIQGQFVRQAEEKGGDPEDIAEAKELFESFRAAAAKIDFDDLMHESFVHIYAKYFTEQELVDLVAFYTTPTGRKTIEVLDDLMRDGMKVGMEKFAPKLEEAMTAAMSEHEKKRPWRRTMSDMRNVSTALEAHFTDNDRYPTGDYASLKETLKDYVDEFPEKDIWGHAYAYVVSSDGQSYRLVSAGADSIFEWDSRRLLEADEETPTRYRDRLEDDIIFTGEQFLQLPVQARPRE